MRPLHKNKLLNVAIFSISALSSATAFAANSETNWEGLYGGITLGALQGKADPDTTTTDGSYFQTGNISKLNNTFQKDVSGSSGTASILLGYLKQHDDFIYGIEADLSIMDFDESTNTTTTYRSPATLENTTRTSVKSHFSLAVRPTIGYSLGNTMVQFGAGPVISRFNYKSSFSDEAGANTSSDSDKTAIGVSTNLGVKHKFSNNIIMQVDYVYSHYSNIVSEKSLLGNSTGNANFTDEFSNDSDFTSHNLRIGLVKYF